MKTNNTIEKTSHNISNTTYQMTKYRQKRLNCLYKGKIKNIGVIEGVRLKIAGKTDGARGLPREMDNRCWLSAFIDREVNAYEEFCSRMWGSLQIEEEEIFSRIGELIDSISHLQSALDQAKEHLSAQSQEDEYALSVRKKGEEKLTEAQVQSRRRRERDRRLAPARNKVSSLESRLSDHTEEFFALRNMIIENNNTTRMICNRVKDHTLQRIDTYWIFAMRNHTDGIKMPTVPHVDLSFDAEKVYIEPHRELIDKAEELAKLIVKKDEKEDN